ncbi:hypothetical protein LUZ60_004657 [Juncus effusus]|nr:hypothetical protein LUZ60_004657 [Juncus effusus]
MMLPGVELARKRRIHYHEIQPWGPQDHPAPTRASSSAQSGMTEPALAARIRLEEKLRGAAGSPASSHSSSRWTRFIHDTGSPSRQQNTNIQTPEARSKSNTTITNNGSQKKLASEDLCAVCLEELVRGKEKVTWLPCSHKYHSDCVLPWLASHPDCPCCRTTVPPTETIIS